MPICSGWRRAGDDGAPVLVMPFATDVLGRPGFLHGGAIGGLLEMAAIVALHDALEGEGGGEIKPINVTVDFMRGGRDKDTRAAASSPGSAPASPMSRRPRGRTIPPSRSPRRG